MVTVEIVYISCPECKTERSLIVGRQQCYCTCSKCDTNYRFIEDLNQCDDCQNEHRLECIATPTVFIERGRRSSWSFNKK
jgi:hypothetical protein